MKLTAAGILMILAFFIFYITKEIFPQKINFILAVPKLKGNAVEVVIMSSEFAEPASVVSSNLRFILSKRDSLLYHVT